MSQYTVRREEGCVVIEGSVPIDEFVGLVEVWERRDENMILDSMLAHRLGVNFVLGTEQACTAWRVKLGLASNEPQQNKEYSDD
jgi:hypothetical protein